MDAHTWAFIAVLFLIGVLAGVDLYLFQRINGVEVTLGQIAEVLYKLRSEGLSYDDPPPRHRHKAGSGGPGGGAAYQANLPDAQRETGGA